VGGTLGVDDGAEDSVDCVARALEVEGCLVEGARAEEADGGEVAELFVGDGSGCCDWRLGLVGDFGAVFLLRAGGMMMFVFVGLRCWFL
jgi:hypothetical protein